MHFVGVDLAWAGRNPTGVAVLDAGDRLVHIGATHDDAAIIAALRHCVAGQCLVGFDAPMVVTNPTGHRPAEAALNRDFRRFDAGAHPANTGRPSRSIRIRRPWCWFRLARTLKYKAKPGRSLDQLRSGLLLLMDGVEKLADARGAVERGRS